MYYNQIKLVPILSMILLLAFGLTSCSDDDDMEIEIESVEGQSISLTANSTVQIALIDAKDDISPDSYIRLLDETVEKNNGVHIGTFEVYFVGEGQFFPQQFRFYQYNNDADALGFQNDQNQQTLTQIAENDLRSIQIGYGIPVADVSYQFRTDKVYEVFSADLLDFDALTGFFPVQDYAKENFGRNEFLSLQGNPNVIGNWSFMVGGLVEWPDAETFYEFVNTSTFLDGVEQFRDPALDNLVLINGNYIQ